MSRAFDNDRSEPPHESRTDEFLQLYAGSESRLFAYLMSLLGNYNDAQDVSQETLLALWRSFGEFQPGTDFYAWARRVAYHRVLTYRKQRRRQGVPCSESFLAAVEQTCDRQSDRLERSLRHLDECMARLTDSDRVLLQTRFQSAASAKNVAESLGRPANTVYKALARIYRSLAECVTRAMSREERP
jgi:RNA polymerase sigma-70 factor (ECF subfamily)